MLSTSNYTILSNMPTMPQLVSVGNSATRTVTEGVAQFVGIWDLTRSIGVIRQLVVLASNVPSGLGGTLIFEYSEDGVTATISESRTIGDFSTLRDFDLFNAGAYFRIKFTPSRALVGVEAVYITTTYSTQFGGQFVRLATQQIEKANAAMPSGFSFLKGFLPNGKSTDVLFNPESQPIFADYNTEVARGNIAGASTIRREARNSSVTTTEQIIWQGGAAFNFLLAATTIRIRAGGNANDTAAGSGARSITIEGLDDLCNPITAILIPAGASASASTAQSFRRVTRFYMTGAGTYATGVATVGSNTGTITLETTGGVLMGVMSPNFGRGNDTVESIPNGKVGYLKRLRVTPEGNKAVTFRLWTRENLDTTTAPFAPKILRATWDLIVSEAKIELAFPIRLPAKSEIWITAQTGTGTSAASAAFEIELLNS